MFIINIEYILEISKLFLLGIIGWGILSAINIPAPALLGPVLVIGTLRILKVPLVSSPDFLPVLVQIVMGYVIGSGITKNKIMRLKAILIPAFIISIWAISIIFILGFILIHFLNMDIYTALLASSMGGLAEMTLISIAVGAETSIVVIIHTLRVIITLGIFPILAEKIEKKPIDYNLIKKYNKEGYNNLFDVLFIANLNKIKKIYCEVSSLQLSPLNRILKSYFKIILIFSIATIGGFIVLKMGVPAGAMVGSMLTVSFISLKEIEVKPLSIKFITLIMIATGIMVIDNISEETIELILSSRFILIILISSITIFLSSFFVAYLIHKITGWDKLTCFLSSAPGGFTVLAGLAMKYERDLFVISLLHLCRLVLLKILVPIVFAVIA